MSEFNKYLILLGRSIKEYRKKQKLTQAEFAKKAGLHRSYIGSIERGERNISFLKMLQISAVLETKVFDVISFLKNYPFSNKS